MAHTSEERDKLSTPLCGAKKRNGEKCRAFAGQGTDHPGTGRCKYHLGSTKNHKQAAVTAEARQRMVKLGMPIEVAPHEAMLWLLYAGSGHCAWLNRTIADMEDLGTHEGQVMVSLYGEERDRLARVAEICLRAGATAEQLRIIEQYADQMAAAFKSAFHAVPGLSEEQQRALVQTFFLELQTQEPTGEEPPMLPAAVPAAASPATKS